MAKDKEIKDLSDLRQDESNARKHTPRNVGMIENSLRQIGAARSGVIDENGRILAGNGTYEALSNAGIRKVKVVDADGEEWVVVRRKGLTEEQKRILSISDNRAAELAEWDASTLEAQGIDLAPWFTPSELDGYGIGPTPEPTTRELDENSESSDRIEIILSGPPDAFTARFLDELHKFCQKYGVIVQNDDVSRPKRRYWGSWKKGEVEKPE